MHEVDVLRINAGANLVISPKWVPKHSIQATLNQKEIHCSVFCIHKLNLREIVKLGDITADIHSKYSDLQVLVKQLFFVEETFDATRIGFHKLSLETLEPELRPLRFYSFRGEEQNLGLMLDLSSSVAIHSLYVEVLPEIMKTPSSWDLYSQAVFHLGCALLCCVYVDIHKSITEISATVFDQVRDRLPLAVLERIAAHPQHLFRFLEMSENWTTISKVHSGEYLDIYPYSSVRNLVIDILDEPSKDKCVTVKVARFPSGSTDQPVIEGYPTNLYIEDGEPVPQLIGRILRKLFVPDDECIAMAPQCALWVKCKGAAAVKLLPDDTAQLSWITLLLEPPEGVCIFGSSTDHANKACSSAATAKAQPDTRGIEIRRYGRSAVAQHQDPFV
jgi:hypothetical protein